MLMLPAAAVSAGAIHATFFAVGWFAGLAPPIVALAVGGFAPHRMPPSVRKPLVDRIWWCVAYTAMGWWANFVLLFAVGFAAIWFGDYFNRW